MEGLKLYIPINFNTVIFHLQHFFYLQQGDKNLENVTHEEAVATLKATPERVVLIVGKPDQVYSPPPPPISTSPQLCKYCSFTIHTVCIYKQIQ